MFDTGLARGRIGPVALVVLALLALGLFLFSERAVPPEVEPEPEPPVPEAAGEREPPPDPARPGNGQTADDNGETIARQPLVQAEAPPVESLAEQVIATPAPPIDLTTAGARLRLALADVLAPEQLDRVVTERLVERIVTTVNSLDGDAVPLRFRPLAHVPGLPKVVEAGEHWRLPEASDPRYAPYREMFDRISVEWAAALFGRHEPALEQAWRDLAQGSPMSFRERTVEVLNHLAGYELPARRPLLHRPEVLYEYVDPKLEAASWGRKLLIRVGPAHAPAVQRKLAALSRVLDAQEESDTK